METFIKLPSFGSHHSRNNFPYVVISIENASLLDLTTKGQSVCYTKIWAYSDPMRSCSG